MKITKVRVKDGGVSGLDIVFSKNEPNGNGSLTYVNKYTKECSEPVSSDLKGLLDGFKSHVINICRLSDIDFEDMKVTGVMHKPEKGTVVTASICTDGEQWYTLNTPCVQTDQQYSDVFKLEKVVEQFFAECVKYGLGKTEVVKSKQYLLDVLDDERLSKKLKFSVDEIKEMDERTAMEEMEKMLEERGAVFMERASDVTEVKQEVKAKGKKVKETEDIF